MSEISPTASQQLAAASVAFHRARRKFTENFGESLYKNAERTQASNKTENATRLRVASGFCCGRNCEPLESAFHHEKTARDAVRDFGKIVSSPKYGDTSLRDFEANEMEEFKDAQDRFDICNESICRPIYKKNCSCLQRMSILHQKSDADAINQFHRTDSPDIDDSKNDDESLDFPRKLYEWERRSREESLMKMQRLQQRRNRLKQEPKCQSLHKHSQCCQWHQCAKISGKPQVVGNASWSSSPGKLHCPKFVNQWIYDGEKERKGYSTGRLHFIPTNAGMHSVPEESDAGESVENLCEIKHRDSVDILVEKMKSKKIQEEQILEGVSCTGAGDVSSNGAQDTLLSKKESKSSEDNRDSETCCSRKNEARKELRFNKLADRLKHKSRRSRLTKSTNGCNDEGNTY